MNTLPAPMQDRLERLINDPAIADTGSETAALNRVDAGQLLELQRLTQSAAYWDPSHIDHELTKAKVRLLHEFEFDGQHARRPSALIFNSGNPSAPPGRQFGGQAAQSGTTVLSSGAR